MQERVAADGATLLRMLESAVEQLERGARTLDAINVFPVPDGDTGTNMLLTVRAALSAVPFPRGPAAGVSAAGVSAAGVSAAVVSAAFARGAMEGARGNSGIILSQFFRGLAAALDGRDTCSAADLAAGFARGHELARSSISDPKEGTILTVLADVSHALEGSLSADSPSLPEALEAAVAAAAASVERTPSLLPVLRESGVVDAGAQGMLLILQGWLRALVDGRSAAVQPALPRAAPRLPPQSGSYGFCTEFILAGEALPLPAIRRWLEQEGTSVILAGDGRTVRVHVHTQRPDDLIAYARSVGSISHLEVQDMDRQRRDASLPAGSPPLPLDTVVVALVEGDGLAAVFRSMGAEAIRIGEPAGGALPSAIARALDRLSARQVILLPTSAPAHAAARAAGVPDGKSVRVVPSRTIPQGIAALVGFRFDRGLEENVSAMTDDLAAVRSVEVPAGSVDPVGELGRELAQSVPSPVESVTIYGSRDADAGLLERAAAVCRDRFPGCTVESVRGGQAHPLLVVSLE